MKKKLILIFLIMATCLVPQAFSAPWNDLLQTIQKTCNGNKHALTLGRDYNIQDIIKKIEDCNVNELLTLADNGWNSLNYLVYMENTETAVERLLEKARNLSAQDKNRFINNPMKFSNTTYANTPLLYSLNAGKDSISKLLIKYGADVNKNYKYNDGTEISALWIAITNNNTDIAKLLIEKGADINRTSDFPDVKNCTPLCYSIYKKNKPLFDLLIENRADINKSASNNGIEKSPLWIALENGLDDYATVLMDNGSDIDRTTDIDDVQKCTPLYYAVLKNKPSIVSNLISKGANPNEVVFCKGDNFKISPLIQAVWNQNYDIIDALLSCPNIDKDLPLEPISGSGNIQTPLFIAIHNNDVKAAEKLINAGADVNSRATYIIENEKIVTTLSNWTPILELGESSEKIRLAELLLKAGADVSIGGISSDSKGSRYENYTPLFKSIDDNDYAFFQKIYEKSKLEKEKLITISDSKKIEYTPLQRAADKKKLNEQILNTLIDVKSFKEKFIGWDGKEKLTGDLLLERNDLPSSIKKRVENLETEVKLFEAVEKNDFQTIHSFLEKGRNPNVWKEKKTPLENAFYNAMKNNGDQQTIKIIKDLASHGAKINDTTSNGDTLLAVIIKKSMEGGLKSTDKELISLLLENGADPKLSVEHGIPLIPFIAEKLDKSSDFELLDFLMSDKIQKNNGIKYIPNIDDLVTSGEYNGWNALSFAINNENANLAEYILEKKSKGTKITNKIQKNDKTWLGNYITQAMNSGLNENLRTLIRILLENGADPKLAIENNLPLVPYIVERSGAGTDYQVLDYLFSEDIQENKNISSKPDINQIIPFGDYKGLNSLCLAIKNNNSGLVDYLVKNGAKTETNLKAGNNGNFTALGYACKSNMERCAEELIANKASIKEFQEIYGAKRVTVLMAACSKLSWSFTNRILTISSEEINKLDSLGKNAFMYAAEFNSDKQKSIKLMRNLRSRKADINKITPSGDNAVSLAIKNKQPIEIVMWLLENGVSFRKKLDFSELEHYQESEYYSLLNNLNAEVK